MTTTTPNAFEPMSKRRKGYPSETKVKRGVRIIQGKQLEEKLGRNDLCPCGSGQRFKRCCLRSGRL
ncbi:SEC-C motif domain protein [Rhodopirellula maiorica SM1]|nr:SEC-C metal-binding domain-containing protein [Rhodopirellula maiorica]EMI18790.1 SEC-C motif domain protein [Rhodopirellula maiorica SM1]